MTDTGATSAASVVLRLSPIATASYLVVPGLLGFFALFLAGVVPTVAGKVAGLIAIVVAEVVFFRWLLRRLASIRATFTDKGVTWCNSPWSRATFEVPWQEVATVDRGWKHFGSPLGLRGSMLRVSPLPGARWSGFFVEASYAARASTCAPVVALLKRAATEYGFTVPERVGDRFSFARPGNRWTRA